MRHAGRLLEVVAIACALVALIAVSASVAVAFGGHDKAAPPAAKPEPVYGIPAYDPLITRFGVDSGCGKWPEPLVMRYGNCFEPTSPTTSAN